MDFGSLALTLIHRVDRACDDFEAAWRAGHRPRIENALAEAAGPEQSVLLRALLASELELRRKFGEQLSPEEYLGRFPEYPELVRSVFGARSATPSLRTSALNAPDEPVLANYEILGELGRGGMGVVYRARDRRRDQVVALKTVQRAAPADLLRFKQEFRTLADVSHPNLVTLYELAFDGRSWFFTMELIDGVDILTYVRSPAERMALGPGSSGSRSPEVDIADTRVAAVLTEPHTGLDQAEMLVGDPALEPGPSPSRLGRLRASFMQLAEGVDALHDAGKLHRDIKPSNVLVTRRGRVVLLDFGLAAELEPSGLHQSSEPHILGTIAYMAPEQAACLPVAQASDWYSVGVMLYESLTGRLPFVGRQLDVLMEKQRRAPSPPREIVADVPADLGELCAALLRRDPEARPDGAEVLRRLRAQPPGVPAPSPTCRVVGTTGPFVGRAHHLAALSNAYSVMKQSGTVLVLVHGRSGVGKTALVQRFVESLPADDRAVVLPSRCYAQESVPYKALDGVIDSLGRTLRRLPATDVQAVLPRDFPYLWQAFPTLRLVEGAPTPRRRLQEIADPRELRLRCVAALRDLLGRLSDRCPLVLFIDDLQWGDYDSAELLADCLQPPDPPALLLVGCYRREDAGTSPFLTRLRGAIETPGNRIDCRELAVDELAAEDAVALARSLYGPSLDDPAREARAASVARESEGNPFFIGELVRHTGARSDGLDAPSGGWQVRLVDVLRERLGGLSPEARNVLEVIAVFSGPIGEAEACRAAGVEEAGPAALGELRAGRWVRSACPEGKRDLYEIYHDRIREALLSLIPAPALEDHHLRLASTLRAMDYPDAEALAVHFREAGRHAEASGYFAEAGDQAVRVLAFDRASTLYRAALELGPPDGDGAQGLRVKLGDALANAGRGGEAAGEYLAAAGDNSDVSLDLRRRSVLQYLISGHVDEGLATLRSVLNAVGMTLPRSSWSALASLLFCRAWLRVRGTASTPRAPSEASRQELSRIDVCWSASIGLSIIDPIRGADFQARGLLRSLRAGDPHRVVRALAMEAAHVACAGVRSRHRAAKLLDAAESVARKVPGPYTSGIVLLAKAMVATLESRWQETRGYAEPAEATFRDRCTGVAWEIDTARIFSLWSLMYLGEIAELQRRWPGLMKDANERDDLYAAGTLGTSLMAVVRLAAGDPDAAEDELRQASGRWSRQGFHIQHHNHVLAECYISLYRGDDWRVWECLSALWPAYMRSLLLRVQIIRIELRRLRALGALTAAKASGDPGPFLKSAAREARSLEAERLPGASAHARLIRAQAAAATGDFEGARPLLEAAIRDYTTSGMSIFAAAARRRLGGLLGGDDGRALVAEADAWMSSQGIRNPARMAALYAAPGPRPEPGSGP